MFKQHTVFSLFNTIMFSTKQNYDIHAVAAELAENERTKSNIPTNKKPTCTSNLKVINGIKYNSIQ